MVSLPHRNRHVVALLGRFGNQLFQYSFAKWLARETHREVRLDLAMTRTVGIAGTDEFIRAVNELAIRGSRGFPAPGGRLGPLGGYLRKALGPDRVVIDVSASGMDNEDFSRPAWWVGYWQQLRFAEVARDELRGLLEIAPVRGNGPQRIAVHVRRGDYVDLGLALSPDWYRTAVHTALGMTGQDAEVEVVSDDPAWCRDNLQFDVPFSVASQATPLDHFRRMAHADVMVASASTYSWWAGFLGQGQVLYPRDQFVLPIPRLWYPVPLSGPPGRDVR